MLPDNLVYGAGIHMDQNYLQAHVRSPTTMPRHFSYLYSLGTIRNERLTRLHEATRVAIREKCLIQRSWEASSPRLGMNCYIPGRGSTKWLTERCYLARLINGRKTQERARERKREREEVGRKEDEG